MIERKIVIVCGTLESGGAERVISTLSKPLADTFEKISIITWREAAIFYEIDSRVNIISLPKLANSNSTLKKGLYFRSLIKKSKPNIIISFLTPFNMLTDFFLLGVKVKIINAERNDPRFLKGGFLMKKLRNLLYGKANGILCQTEYVKAYFKGTLNKKCHIIYNPVFMAEDMAGAALKTKKENRIVSVGRLHYQKNHKLLIDAFKIFHSSHNQYTLTIYGTGDLYDETIEYVRQLNLENAIELAGEKENVKELILNAKAFVMTSRFEGMSNALIEAMCLGLPCISTKVSGATDLIFNGENGFLVGTDASKISEALSLITDNEEISSRMGHKAINTALSLNVNSIAKNWIDYICLLCN